METENRASLAYKGLREIPREFLRRLKEMQVVELDLSHNELTYPFTLSFYYLFVITWRPFHSFNDIATFIDS